MTDKEKDPKDTHKPEPGKPVQPLDEPIPAPGETPGPPLDPPPPPDPPVGG